jgi:Tfp pilus assembly protein PilO
VTTPYSEYSTRTQLLIVGLLCLALAGVACQQILGPARANLVTRQAHLAELAAEVVRARVTAATLPAAEQEVLRLERALRETTAMLPEEKDPQDVLRQLHELAGDSGLDLSRFTPKTIVPKEQYSEWAIELELDGGYHDLARFFEGLAAMRRLTWVADLQIRARAQPAPNRTVTASCTVMTIVFGRDASSPAPPTPTAPPGMGGEQ